MCPICESMPTHLSPEQKNCRRYVWRRAVPVVLAAFVAGGCSGSGQTWEALLVDLPARIQKKDAEIQGIYYVLKQTHEPLFRKDDGENYTTKLLSRWSRDQRSATYEFCPDTRLRFNKETPFSREYFAEYISSAALKYSPDAAVHCSGPCCRAEFNRPAKGFLEFLTRYENAPAIEISTAVEQGLGQFEVTEMSKQRIALRRKKRVRRGYEAVILHQYTGPKDANLENRRISDFNKLAPEARPDWIKKEYVSFHNFALKSVNIFINHPDPKVRRFLYNCIDAGKFRNAFMPNLKNYSDLSTVLPMGLPGASAGRPQQSCGGKNEVPYFTGPIVLADQNGGNLPYLQAFSDEFYSRTGRRIKIELCSVQDLIKLVKSTSGRRPYTLAVGVAGTAWGNYTSLFMPVCGEARYIDHVPAVIKDQCLSLSREDDPAARAARASKLAASIADEGLLLTLFQPTDVLQYPGGVTNLIVGRGFLEYPEIAELLR